MALHGSSQALALSMRVTCGLGQQRRPLPVAGGDSPAGQWGNHHPPSACKYKMIFNNFDKMLTCRYPLDTLAVEGTAVRQGSSRRGEQSAQFHTQC
jgi:hypothetical protein